MTIHPSLVWTLATPRSVQDQPGDWRMARIEYDDTSYRIWRLVGDHEKPWTATPCPVGSITTYDPEWWRFRPDLFQHLHGGFRTREEGMAACERVMELRDLARAHLARRIKAVPADAR